MTKPVQSYDKIAFVASAQDEADAAKKALATRYGDIDPAQADVVVALGGDGLMLQTLHRFRDTGKPIYGMSRGSIGFLMNEFVVDGLKERIAAAERTVIHPLAMEAIDAQGKSHHAPAINEVYLFRETYQAAKLRLSIDGKVRLAELICDGILVATPAGSTAYNLSAHGPILPINAPLLALTPISPFRPRRWRGALLPNKVHITVHVLESDKRPVSAVADHFETRGITRVEVEKARNIELFMMFDADHSLDERV